MISLLALTPFDSSLFAFDWLFAIDVQVIGIIIFIIVTILSGISQFINKQKEEAARQRRLAEQAKREMAMRQMEQEGGRREEPQRQFGRLPEQRPKPAAPVDENVAAEIRDFLERAATGRPAGQAAPQPKPIPSVVATPVSSANDVHHPLADRPPHHTSIGQRSMPTSHPTVARPVEARPVPERQTANQAQLQAQKLAEAKRRQAAAARSKQAGDSKFDRKLGSLEKRASRSKTAATTTVLPNTMAADIAAIFADTNNIRQAIIINEVLTRPVHRW